MLSQIQANTNKAYVALQTYVTSPSYIGTPGVVHTERTHLTREQIAARYLKSVEGNPDIDINKAEPTRRYRTPKLVQKPAKSPTDASGLMIGYPRTEDEIKTRQISRNLMETSSCGTGLLFSRYQEIAAELENLEYTLVDASTEDACMSDLPEFVVCRDEYLKISFPDTGGYPQQELNYRKSTSDNEKINLEINQSLQKNKATRIFLTREQFDSYFLWRLLHGGEIKFPHIRVEEKGTTGRTFALAALGIGTVSALTYLMRKFCHEASTNNDKNQKASCLKTSCADRSSADGNQELKTSTSPTNSSNIVGSEKSGERDSEAEGEEIIEMQQT